MRTNFAFAGGVAAGLAAEAAGKVSLAGDPPTRTVTVALPEDAGAEDAGAEDAGALWALP